MPCPLAYRRTEKLRCSCRDSHSDDLAQSRLFPCAQHAAPNGKNQELLTLSGWLGETKRVERPNTFVPANRLRYVRVILGRRTSTTLTVPMNLRMNSIFLGARDPLSKIPMELAIQSARQRKPLVQRMRRLDELDAPALERWWENSWSSSSDEQLFAPQLARHTQTPARLSGRFANS